jgi:hypothetical protein
MVQLSTVVVAVSDDKLRWIAALSSKRQSGNPANLKMPAESAPQVGAKIN